RIRSTVPVVEVPRRLVDVPRRLVDVPRRLVDVPRRLVDVPRRLVLQLLQREISRRQDTRITRVSTSRHSWAAERASASSVFFPTQCSQGGLVRETEQKLTGDRNHDSTGSGTVGKTIAWNR